MPLRFARILFENFGCGLHAQSKRYTYIPGNPSAKFSIGVLLECEKAESRHLLIDIMYADWLIKKLIGIRGVFRATVSLQWLGGTPVIIVIMSQCRIVNTIG